MKQKIGCLFLIVSVVLFLGACSKKEQTSLYDQGMEIVGLMVEMVNNKAYGEMLTGSPEVAETAEKIAAGSYTKPSAVYEIVFPSMEEMLAVYGETEMLEGLSENLTRHLNNRLQSAVMTQFNAQGGANSLAAASIYTAGKTFVSEELKENKVYFYTFDQGSPIAVTFVAGEDHSVSATGGFLLTWNDGTSGEEPETFTTEELQEMLQAVFGENCSVQKLDLDLQ